MINYFTFNGKSSLDFGIYVTGRYPYNTAEKDYTTVSVPGRNGDLFIFNNYKNVALSYPAIIMPSEDYRQNTIDIRNWLMAKDGYLQLEDTYNPDEIRLATYSGSVSFETYLFKAGSTTLSFSCKPQRYLKTGQEPITITTSGSTITNPTEFEASPLIIVYGYGAFKINDTEVSISVSTYEHVDIDCEAMICYNKDVNLNNYLVIGDFPTLKPGDNTITFDSTITKMEITPRWWRI